MTDFIPTSPLPRASTQVIDAHGHFGVPGVDRLVADRPEHKVALQAMAAGSGEASMRQNLTFVLPRAAERFASIEARLADLDMIGIDLQIVSPSPHLYNYWADPALAEDIVGQTNAAAAALVAQAPTRLAALGLAALQHPEMAARQIREAMAAGLKGIEISTSVGQRELSDPSLEPVWQTAVETGAVIFIHPLGTSLGPRLAGHYLSNIVGQPLETTVALSHMIFSGVFDRHPTLKILAAHAGGYLPHYIGRSDHAWKVRPESKGCAEPPSHYLSRIWHDTVIFDNLQLRNLISRVGADRVLFGTDYAFDMGDYYPNLLDLTEAEREPVLGGNARQLFGL